VTLDTGDNVQIRAIDVNNGQLTTGAYWEADVAWYNPADAYADFVVDPVSTQQPWRWGLLVNQMSDLAGRPVKIYHYGGYTIGVWDQNLLTRLH
jgi:hypothetical protein